VNRLYGQHVAAFQTAAGQDLAPTGSLHSLTKTVHALTTALARLIGTFDHALLTTPLQPDKYSRAARCGQARLFGFWPRYPTGLRSRFRIPCQTIAKRCWRKTVYIPTETTITNP